MCVKYLKVNKGKRKALRKTGVIFFQTIRMATCQKCVPPFVIIILHIKLVMKCHLQLKRMHLKLAGNLIAISHLIQSVSGIRQSIFNILMTESTLVLFPQSFLVHRGFRLNLGKRS